MMRHLGRGSVDRNRGRGQSKSGRAKRLVLPIESLEGRVLLAANLVAAYAFDEGTGSAAADASGTGNNGTLAGPTWVAGKNGGGLSFDGVNDWVTVADANSLDLTTAMTLSAWVRPTALANW